MTFRNPLSVAAALCLLAWAHTSTANEQQPHQHGHAQLQIAVDGKSIDLILTSPAHNLLGFEHQPRTKQQKQTLENARQWLITQALIAPADSNCTVESASMDFSATAPDQDHHNEHHNGNHNDADDVHANIEVSQLLNCTGKDLSGGFTTPLMGQFPQIQELNVEWITSSGQGSTRLSASNNQFRF